MEYRKLGRFHISQTLAKGGMGEIVKSVDDSGRTIALKTILREFEGDTNFRELFLREAEITFHLDHPNIVQAYRFDSIGNRLVLALEYLQGVNLKDILRELFDRKIQMPLSLVVAIVSRVLAGLHYAHEKRDWKLRHLGIVHRDLNPSNIFVTYTGEVKILDFGISKATQKEIHQLTPKGEVRGKMCYLSPEQIRGQEVDRRTDIYSLGIVMWELLTGRPLFLRDTDTDVMKAIAQGVYQPLKHSRSDVPEAFEEVLKRALSVSPKNRFATAKEFQEAIDEALQPHLMPGVGMEEISIFVRSLFRVGMDSRDADFLSGYGWLLMQVPGQERSGFELVASLAEANKTRPYVQLNFARCLLLSKEKAEGLRELRRLARVDSLESVSQSMLEWLGVRRRPVVPFLKRSNLLNHLLGRIRHAVLGPIPYRVDFASQ